MKGYKVFGPDWKCRNYQYKVGEVFEKNAEPVCCSCGFHFCVDLRHCFNYYSFDPGNKVAEIEAIGDIDSVESEIGTKYCTNKIKIVREITWEEVLRTTNEGRSCTGVSNVGNFNSGNHNNGDYNSGDYNKGDYNNGYCNYGDYNIGGFNRGDNNSGGFNTGDCNSGSFNTGIRNTGYYNIGAANAGDGNHGKGNVGNNNIGDGNSGDWNKTSHSSGCFNTKEPKILMFNKPSDWTYKDWRNSKAYTLLDELTGTGGADKWVYLRDMTEEEKEAHPECTITGGYLKDTYKSVDPQSWWRKLDNRNKDVILKLPNFDKKIFKEITGITV